jgi:hypothetical protein
MLILITKDKKSTFPGVPEDSNSFIYKVFNTIGRWCDSNQLFS